MHRHIAFLPISACLTIFAPAQAVPTATATPSLLSSFPAFPLIDGQFDYGLNASEVVQSGYGSNGQNFYSTNLSGDLVYSTRSNTHPFSTVYAGGVLLSNQNNYATQFFQNLTLTQGLNTRGWNVNVSDSISYLPSSPTVGLSGIPGTGDLGSQPIFTGDQPAQDVLTIDNNRISNTVVGGISRHLGGTTSISGSGSYGILRFLSGSYGLDSTQISGDLALNRQFDARDTGSLGITYSVFSFPGAYSFTSRGLNIGFNRRLTRSLTVDASGGPLWINSSESLGIPSSLNTSADAGITYSRNNNSGGVHFTRGVNGGSGVQAGALATGVQASYQHAYGRGWALGVTQTYFHSHGLSDAGASINTNPLLSQYLFSGTISSSYSGAQLSRRFTDNLSGYLSYTAQVQSLSNTPGINANALSGLSNVFGIGISFSPRSTHLGQF